MKILSLRFKNLNSLVGEWTIDFTHPQYTADGIFAISGPTGAGKSTILDAICLALYGRTPRLDKITTSTNEIMSRRTKECFAEVVFESNKGIFKCYWSQTRANKTLRLQNTNFEISDYVTGKIIASKIKDTATAIIERTGMDFNRFTQSMLLAQGGFAKFLQANASERAPILEEITGTEIYSTISALVFERNKCEFNKLELIKVETEGIHILNNEEVELLSSELNEIKVSDHTLNISKAQVENSINWLNDIDKLNKEIQNITQEEATHKDALQAFIPDREVLVKANRAYEIEAEYAKLTSLRDIQKTEKTEFSTKEQLLPELKDKIEKGTLLASIEIDTLKKINSEAITERETIKEVREIDVQLKNAANNLSASEVTLKSFASSIEKSKSEIISLDSKIASTQKQAEAAKNYSSENSADESLHQQLAVIKLSITGLDEQRKVHATSKAHSNTAQENWNTANKQVEGQLILLKSAQDKHAEVKKLVINKQTERNALLENRPLAEYRKDLENLMEKNVLINKIKNLESHRNSLEDGKECPLCGSVHHPYAQGNIPDIEETELQIIKLKKLIGDIEKLERELLVTEKTESDALNAVNTAESRLTILRNDLLNCQTNLTKTRETEEIAGAVLSQLQTEIIKTLQPYGFNQVDNTATIINSLQTRLTNWNKNQQIKTDSETLMNGYKANIATQDALLLSAQNSLSGEQIKYDHINIELTGLKEKRMGLYGQKDPSVEELRLNKALENASTSERNASTILSELKKELETLENRIQELKGAVSKRKSDLEQLELVFLSSLTKAEFYSENEFCAGRIEKELRDKLSVKSKTLDDKTAEMTSRKSDREKTLAVELNKMLTDTPLEKLKEELNDTDAKITAVKERIGAINQKSKDNEIAKKEHLEKIIKFEKQGVICKKWETLNGLIGQKDGAKFSRFAQGITFEIMVSHANKQLTKLTDRYLLIRDTNEPLDLNVIDNYQAGECRSTKNLSGGESFIISLALALGLSSMSSKNVRIDSLFLDEGFGTLDEETLEVALDTLASLQQEGKLIGIISHVGLLKERINARIEVVKGNSGKSTLSGPGCSSLII